MRVHRCRFVNWAPTGSTAVAYTSNGEYLAVARADGGDVEIWNVANGYHLEKTIAGLGDVTIRALCWIDDGEEFRLFSGSDDGALTEYDLKQLGRKTTTTAYGGAVWCMAAARNGSCLFVGTDDGCVRVYNVPTSEVKVIDYVRSFEPQPGRLLSMDLHPTRDVLVTGSSEGSINWCSIEEGKVQRRMVIGQVQGTRDPPHVWAVRALSNNTVVSGDSLGQVCFWDGLTGTQLQCFSYHIADILSLTATSNGRAVFASGIDNKIAHFQCVISKGAVQKWVYSSSRRPHTHDVNCLVVAPKYGTKKSEEVLLSAGVDAQLIVYPADSFNVAHPKKYLPFPHTNLLSMSVSRRLLLCQHRTSLSVWRIGKEQHGKGSINGSRLPLASESSKLFEFHTKSSRHVTCSAMSSNGVWVALSDESELRLFNMEESEDGELALRSVEIDAPAAQTLIFSTDNSRLIVGGTDARIHVIDLASNETLKIFDQHCFAPKKGKKSAVKTCLLRMTVSNDSQWLASGDGAGVVHLYNLDTLQFFDTVPKLEQMHTSITFDPSGTSLVVCTTDNRFHIFDVEERRMSDWTREFCDKIPKQLLRKQDKIFQVAFNPARPSTIMLVSHNYICYVDLDKPIPVEQTPGDWQHKKGKKRGLASPSVTPATKRVKGGRAEEESATKAAAGTASTNFFILDKYKSVMHAEFLEGDALAVVEVPWLGVLENFPEVLYRPRYGT